MPQHATPPSSGRVAGRVSSARDARASRVLALASAALLALVTLFVPAGSLISPAAQADASSAVSAWCGDAQGRPDPHAALLNTAAARGIPPETVPSPYPGLITATAPEPASLRGLGGPDHALARGPSAEQDSAGPAAPRAPPAPRSDITVVSG